MTTAAVRSRWSCTSVTPSLLLLPLCYHLHPQVMEHCDHGSLHAAIQRGIFKPTSRWGPKLALRALIRTVGRRGRCGGWQTRAGARVLGHQLRGCLSGWSSNPLLSCRDQQFLVMWPRLNFVRNAGMLESVGGGGPHLTNPRGPLPLPPR